MKKIIKRITAVCMILILTGINCMDFNIARAESGKLFRLTGRLNIMQNGYQINQEKPESYSGIYEITSEGTGVGNGSIQVQSGNHIIILNCVNIDFTDETVENSPIYIKSGSEVIFYIKGASSISVKGDMAGIYVEKGARAEFRVWDEDAEEELTANMEIVSESGFEVSEGKEVREEKEEKGVLRVSAENGAAIGGKVFDSAGTLEFRSGKYKLSSKGGAAIGGGCGQSFDGDIIIYGGDIEAYSENGASIGSGRRSDFEGNIKIFGGSIKANQDRDVPRGGDGGKGGDSEKTLGRAGYSGGSGFGGIGAGGGRGGDEGEAGIYENQPGNGGPGENGGDMNGGIYIYGGCIETSIIGGGNAGSGGGGGSTGCLGGGEDYDITESTANGSGGNGGDGGNNNGIIEIYGGEIKARAIGGGNGGNGGGTGGIWYKIADGEGVEGGKGGDSGYTYSGDGVQGEQVLEYKMYRAGLAGRGGSGGTVIINGGEIYGAVKIGGYEGLLERNAGRIYGEYGYQTYDCGVLNPNMDAERVMVEIDIPADGFKLPSEAAMKSLNPKSKTVQILKPYEMETSVNTDGTLTLWLEEGQYDFWLTADNISYFANNFDVCGNRLNYVTVIPCGNIDLSEISAEIGQEGYDDGNGNFIPFVSSINKPYVISGGSEDSGLSVEDEGVYYFKLENVNAGSENVPFLSLKNSPEVFLEAEGQGSLRGIWGCGTVTIKEDMAYEIRDIDSSVIIKDGLGNLRYGVKILTPWKNEEVRVVYNGNIITRRTDWEGALYPLLLKGEEQHILIEFGAASLKGNINVAGNSWSSLNTINEYNCRDWELSLDLTKGPVGIVKKDQGYEVSFEGTKVFNYMGNNVIEIDGKGETTDSLIYVEGTSAKVKFNNVRIKTQGEKSPVTIGEGTFAEILLDGENYITNVGNAAGIRVPNGSTLAFGGEGKITVTGGNKAGGIGGVSGESSGNLVIKNGAAADVRGNLGNADGINTFDIGPDCQEVIVENNSLSAVYISGELIDGDGRELSRNFYEFTEDLRNRELTYSLNKKTYFTTTVGSGNGLFLYSVKGETLSGIWVIKEGYCYSCNINNEKKISINFDVPLSPEFQEGMVQGEMVKEQGARIELGAYASPSVPKNSVSYRWFYKAVSEDDFEELSESGAVYTIPCLMPENQGYYRVVAVESNGESVSAEFAVRIGNHGSGGSGGGSTGGGWSGGSAGASTGGNWSGGSGSSGGSMGGSWSGGSAGGSTGGGWIGGSAGASTGGASGYIISAATLIQLDGIVSYDKENLNTVKLWRTCRGVIKSAKKVEIYDKGNWKGQVQVHGKLMSKKENGTEVFFISDYTLKVRDAQTKQEYEIYIDEVVVDPVAPIISIKGNNLKINKKDIVSYKKSFKSSLTVKIKTDFSFSGREGLYYKVVKRGKNVDSVEWDKVRNNKIILRKPMEACIYIKAVDKLGKETIVRTQGFKIE